MRDEKSCKQWEGMQVGLKIWQAFKDLFSQSYRYHQIRKKATSEVHGYGVSDNHTQETDAQVNTADELHALEFASIEYKEATVNLTSINQTLSHSLNQAQETILVLFKKLQALKTQAKAKTQPLREQYWTRIQGKLNRSATAGIMGGPADLTILEQPANYPKQDTK